MAHLAAKLEPHRLSLGTTGAGLAIAGLFVGAAALGVAAYYGLTDAAMQKHFYHSYLFAFCFFLTITLGALFFVIVHHLSRAGWSVTLRRIAEGLSMNSFLMLILALPLLAMVGELYHWSHPEAVAHDPILKGKSAYLNVQFFHIRLAAYFIIWCGLAWFFRAQSVKQDRDGNPQRSLLMEKVAAPAILLFGFSITFFAFDWIKGLNAHWFSTIFGVYFFAGCFLSFVSLTVLISLWLKKRGLLGHAVNGEHIHDLGKWMFAFTFFWGYIAFSQYMLIWYANIPEETQFYIPRQLSMWGSLTVILLLVHLLIPFPGLLSRHSKRWTSVLAFWAVWQLCAHAIDLYWLIIPNQWINEIPATVTHDHHTSMPLQVALPQLVESTHSIYTLNPQYASFLDRINYNFQTGPLAITLLCFIGMGGLYLFSTVFALRGKSLVPLKDPRLPEALQFENM